MKVVRDFGLVAQVKDEKTRKFLESLSKSEKDRPLKRVYYKMRNGRVVDQVWRAM